MHGRLKVVAGGFEIHLLLAIVATFLGVNILTAALSPTVWMDEVMFADPAINLRLAGQFVSTAWYAQATHEFWSGNAPLHSLLLAVWLHAFPITPTAIRSINYLYMTGVVLALWVAIRRCQLIISPLARLFFVLLVLLAYGVAFSYRSGRYDCLGMLLLALIALAFTIEDSRHRSFVLLGLAALLPWTGLHLIALIVAVLTLHVIVFRRITSTHVAVAGGMVVGAMALAALYLWQGTLMGFAASTRPHVATALASVAGSISALPSLYCQDPSTLLLLPVVLLFPSVTRCWRPEERRVAHFLALWVVGVPPMLYLAGKFPIYYTWMIFVPLSFLTLYVVERMEAAYRLLSLSLVGLAIASGSIGLPTRLGVALLEADIRNYEKVQSYVSDSLRADDIVYSDFPGYYPARLTAKKVFLPPYLNVMSGLERKSITAAVVSLGGSGPDAVDESLLLLRTQFGGEWELISRLKGLDRDGHLKAFALAQPYRLAVFRKGRSGRDAAMPSAPVQPP